MNNDLQFQRYYTGFDLNSFLKLSELKQRMDASFCNDGLLNAAIFWLTNAERKKHGLKPFLFYRGLQQSATLHSEQMKSHNFFDHENPYNNSLRTLGDRLAAVHDNMLDKLTTYGENIAKYPTLMGPDKFMVRIINGEPRFYDLKDNELFPYTCLEYAQEVVKGWMNSPGHRRNILHPSFELLGCGCSRMEERGDNYSLWYYNLTQNFGGGKGLVDRIGKLTVTHHNYLVTGKYKLPLVAGQRIYTFHVSGNSNYPYSNIGEVVEKTGRLGIRNISASTWKILLPDKTVRVVGTGQGMPVSAGLKIMFGNNSARAEII